MKLKKPILSGLLTISLLFSLFVPAFAYNSTGSTEDRVTGEDKVQDAVTEYEETNNTSSETQVYATRSSTFTVLVPKTIILNGSDGYGAYVVGAKGDVLAEDSISIQPDSYNLTLYRVDDHTKETPASVTQETTSVTGAQIEAISPAYATMEGSIQANGLKAGSWSTTMTFNIKHNDSQQKTFVITADNKADIGFTDTTTNLDIPSTVYNAVSKEEIPVVAIDDRAFYDSNNLESVSIPNSVESIGNEAFANCDNLSNVVVADEVKEIGTNAFEGVDNVEYSGMAAGSPWGALKVSVVYENFTVDASNRDKIGFNNTIDETLVIPDTFYDKEEGKWYKVTQIGSNAFKDQTNLKSVVIPNTVTSIDDYAFYRCTNLASIDIPNSVTSIGQYVFRDCGNLASIVIPDKVTTIGEGAFYECSSLTSIKIPNSMKSVGNSVFYNCTGLTSVTIPSSVTVIENGAFSGCSGLTSITIPSSVKLIDVWAFGRCTGLKSITIPSSVTEIGNYAFYRCTGLTSVTIPNSVKTIGSSAFGGCTRITAVKVPNTVTFVGNEAFYNVPKVIYSGSLNTSTWKAVTVTRS